MATKSLGLGADYIRRRFTNMIILNAAAQLTALAGVIIIQTAYSIVVARLLGVDDFGRFSFVFSITQILLIGCDLGLHNIRLYGK